ncbi:ABC transporter permease [Ruminococcus sp. HUN007]|uniref:ABC transporter permease n=1 Tax=Ruminococcus sp. HUN007 TaxID=1514668 RepID=UPI0006791B6D|nr:ABC transporter permease [Ruminococcus sp. HUN007]
MLLFENIRQAYNSLVLNKKRTFLTMIGIIIGLSSVLSIVSIGDTVSKIIEDYMVQMFTGGNTIYLVSGWDINDQNSNSDIDYNKYPFDLDEIYDFINSTDGVIIDFDNGTYADAAATIMLDNKHKANVDVKGVTSSYALTQKLRITNGRFINLEECRYRKPVCVITDFAAKSLFGSCNDAIGKTLDFEAVFSETYYDEEGNEQLYTYKATMSLTVVGVYEYVASKGTPDITTENTVTDLLCPSQTFNAVIGEDDDKTAVMRFVVKDKASTEKAKALIESFALDKYGSDPDYNYSVLDILDQLSSITNIISVITGSFVVIAAISLLVGGIGLMNTMLVSVTERTKEIGIKKALGARNSSIRTQFLFESAMICLIACAVGVFFGMFFGMILESNLDKLYDLIPNESFKYFLKNAEVHVTPSVNAIVISTLFSLAVGIIFGLYPANKGARMQPVDALRYE